MGTLAASVENYWLPHWSNEDLLHQQQKDPDITQILNWLEDDILPETLSFSTSHAVQSLRDNSWLQKTNYCFTVLHDASTDGQLGV